MVNLVVNLIGEPYQQNPVKKKGPGCPGTFKKSPRDFWTSLVPGPRDHGTFRVSRSCPVPSRDLPGTSRDGTVLLESLLLRSLRSRGCQEVIFEVAEAKFWISSNFYRFSLENFRHFEFRGCLTSATSATSKTPG